MPIAKWICKGCSGREVPLDHFATTACGDRVVHPDYAAAVLADRSGQPEGVRVTHGLSCPRRAAIEASEPYAMDPVDSLPACSGTAWHAWVEPHGRDEAEVEVRGEVAGIQLVGHIDRVRGDAIEDWKTVQFLPKGMEVKTEHVVQVSIYGYLLDQPHGKDFTIWTTPTKGRIWYKTHFELRPVEFPLMPIEEALEWKPYGGQYSVGELYGQMNAWMQDAKVAKDTNTEHVKAWDLLPLAGQSMMFSGGKNMCSYCSVRSECTIAAMGSEEF